jgi:hypothetical protein
MDEQLTCDSFADFLGSSFSVALDSDETMELELVEAETYPNGEEQGGRQPFALVFRGALDRVLPQRMYQLEHEAMRPQEIFLVPIGPDEQGQRYEAVFN